MFPAGTVRRHLPGTFDRPAVGGDTRQRVQTVEGRRPLGWDITWISYLPPPATAPGSRVRPPASLVYRSRRGHTDVTWSLTLEAVPGDVPGRPGRSRVFLRLRLAPVRHRWLARTAGELLDLVTIAGLAAGLRERLADQDLAGDP